MPVPVCSSASQQALEAAGYADKSDDDDNLPELKAHLRIDGHLRKLYKHTDAYLRAVNTMCEGTKSFALTCARTASRQCSSAELACDLARNLSQPQRFSRTILPKRWRPTLR